jgi:hypothetical protein
MARPHRTVKARRFTQIRGIELRITGDPIRQNDTPYSLPFLKERPPGSLLVPVVDDYCEPILRRGDTAVVNLLNRAVVIDALFLLQFRSGRGGIFRISHAPPGLTIIGSDEHPLIISPPRADNLSIKLSDGPYLQADLDRLIIGRVVGVIDHAQ